MREINVSSRNMVLYETNILNNHLSFKINNPMGINVHFECSLDGVEWYLFSVMSLNAMSLHDVIPKVTGISCSDNVVFCKDELEVVNYIRIRSY